MDLTQCLTLCLGATRGVCGDTSAQSLLPCSNCLQQEGELVPGEPGTSLCWSCFECSG